MKTLLGSRSLAHWLLAIAFMVGPQLFGQQIRGTVRDSATAAPIPGVIVLLQDSAGKVLSRNLTDDRGDYRIVVVPGGSQIRAMRLGFRPVTRSAPTAGNDGGTLDIRIPKLVSLLEGVAVTVPAHCPRRSDYSRTFGLIEQARTALLATVVAREANPARMVRIAYQRTMDGTGDGIKRQIVRIDSSGQASASFSSVLNANEFRQSGFVHDSSGIWTFFAPDAEVLLDPAFAGGYCFNIADASRARPGQIGLAFFAPDRRRERVDIEGTLWIDTVARALVDVEFEYRGLGSRVEAEHPGGRVAFRAMTNGAVLVDRWSIRLISAQNDTVYTFDRRGSQQTIRQTLFAHESGGELVHALWSDGRSWHAQLGALKLRTQLRSGGSARGTPVHLVDTDYRATVDSSGMLFIPDLVPGPYVMELPYDELASIRFAVPNVYGFLAVRDSTIEASVIIPTAVDYTLLRCREHAHWEKGDTVLVLGRALSRQGTPLADARIEGTSTYRAASGVNRLLAYRTGSDGLFEWCKDVTDVVTVKGEIGHQKARPAEQAVTGKLTVIPLVFPGIDPAVAQRP